MSLERYYFIADRAHEEYDSAILHAERNCRYIDSKPEDRLAVVSADGAKLRESGLFLECLICTDGEDGVTPD